MLQAKDYQCIVMRFLFIAGYIYTVTGYEDYPRSTGNSMLYYETAGDLSSDRRLSGMNDARTSWLRKKIQKFKMKTAALFKIIACMERSQWSFIFCSICVRTLQSLAITRFWMQAAVNTSNFLNGAHIKHE